MSVFYDVLMEKTASNKLRKMIEIYDNPHIHSEKQVRRAYNYITRRLGEQEKIDDVLMRGPTSHLATNLRYGGGDVSRRGAYLQRQRQLGTEPYQRQPPAKDGTRLFLAHTIERLDRGVKSTYQAPVSNPRTPSRTEELPDLKTRLEKFKANKERSRRGYRWQQTEADLKRRARQAEDAKTYNNNEYVARSKRAKERARIERDAAYAQDVSDVADLGGLVPYVPPQPSPHPKPQPSPHPKPQPSAQQQSNLKRNLLLAGAGLTTAGGAGYMYHRNKKKRSEQR